LARSKGRTQIQYGQAVSRPTDQEGLGVINTKSMNDSVLVKWIWKIVRDLILFGTNCYKLNICHKITSLNQKSEGLLSFGRAFTM
jgi:hypothetical protein